MTHNKVQLLHFVIVCFFLAFLIPTYCEIQTVHHQYSGVLLQ